MNAATNALLAGLSKSEFQCDVTFIPSAASPTAASVPASMDGAATTIGILSIRPACWYCRMKAMPSPPGWNWNTASGPAARICAISGGEVGLVETGVGLADDLALEDALEAGDASLPAW